MTLLVGFPPCIRLTTALAVPPAEWERRQKGDPPGSWPMPAQTQVRLSGVVDPSVAVSSRAPSARSGRPEPRPRVRNLRRGRHRDPKHESGAPCTTLSRRLVPVGRRASPAPHTFLQCRARISDTPRCRARYPSPTPGLWTLLWLCLRAPGPAWCHQLPRQPQLCPTWSFSSPRRPRGRIAPLRGGCLRRG